MSLYGSDVNSRAASSLVQEHRPVFVVTPLGETEFTSVVFAVAARPGGWATEEARSIEEQFTRDLQTGVWQWEDFPPETRARARELSWRHGPALGCRASDALHIASALALACVDFYTFDRDQAKLARTAGLKVFGR